MGATAATPVRRLPSRTHNEVLWDTAANVVTKSSRDREKILNEAAWLLQSRDAGAVRVLRVQANERTAAYEMEYVAELTVAASLACEPKMMNTYWEDFFAVMPEFLQRLHAPAQVSQEGRDAACASMYLAKTQGRLEQLVQRGGAVGWDTEFRVNKVVLPTLRRVAESLPDLDYDAGLTRAPQFVRIHGDLHPGNMFFSPGSSITLIDPRGSFDQPGAFGDPTYDLAKLAHSFIGGYDAIESGRFRLARDASEFHVDIPAQPAQACQELIDSVVGTYGITSERVRVVHALVMLSLAALHPENVERQTAFVVRGLQLFEGILQ